MLNRATKTTASPMAIRRANANDANAVAAIHAQPHAYAGTLQHAYPALSTWEQRLSSETSIHLLAEADAATVVGHLALHPQANPRRKHSATFGMVVCGTALRRGVGTALLGAAIDLADNWLNIIRLELEVFKDNDAARQLYLRHGFEVEGEHKMSAFRHGSYQDVLSMARLNLHANVSGKQNHD